MEKIKTFLLFEGNAGQALNFYTSLFPESEITELSLYKANEPGPEGTVQKATFVLNGQTFMCIDSPIKHQFSFTPAISLYIDCTTEAEIDKLYKELSNGGQILMPLSAYPFSKKYVWLTDKFGVSWQLSYNH